MNMNPIVNKIFDHLFGIVMGTIMAVCVLIRCIPEMIKVFVKYSLWGFTEGVKLTEDRDIIKFSDIDIGGLF